MTNHMMQHNLPMTREVLPLKLISAIHHGVNVRSRSNKGVGMTRFVAIVLIGTMIMASCSWTEDRKDELQTKAVSFDANDDESMDPDKSKEVTSQVEKAASEDQGTEELEPSTDEVVVSDVEDQVAEESDDPDESEDIAEESNDPDESNQVAEESDDPDESDQVAEESDETTEPELAAAPIFKAESFVTTEGQLNIDYQNYDLVVVPMRATDNQALLKPMNFNLGGEVSYTIAVFGCITGVKVGYLENEESEGLWFTYGDVENSFIEASVNLPLDSSSVILVGNYEKEDGIKEEIRIVLNDVISPEDYGIILRE